jgi:thiamine biosynthesis lipoprotein
LWVVKSGETERDEIPTDTEIEKIKYLIDYKNLQMLEDNQVFLTEKQMKINLGSIVKGYAADEVRRILLENDVNIAMIDLGGNIFAHGFKADGSSWKIGIQNPLEYTGNFLGILQVKDKSIVTSGDYERYFIYDGKKYHHILDTETGYPVDNEIMGVSIISEKSIDGDGLSTTLFALGLDKGMELINSIEGAEAIFITKEKSIYFTEGINDKFILSDGSSGFVIREY